MTSYYHIEDRTLFARGMPWIAEFTEGEVRGDECAVCGGIPFWAAGDMRALLEPKRGTQWPDLIGCGAVVVGLFVASGRFVAALRQEGVRVELGGRVEFAEPGPKRLSLADAPDYHWVDGERLAAARFDFEASGYVGVEHCAACGRRLDISTPSVRDHPVVIDYDASSGLDLFTTDMNPRAFFCTERVLGCARKHRLTNVAFRPLEEGRFAEPVRYWR